MSSTPWLKRILSGLRRGNRRRKRSTRRLFPRHLLPETLEQRRVLAVAISVDDVTHQEGDSGTTAFDFTVSLEFL